MEHDDAPIGRILSRREALSVLGLGGIATLIGCTSNTSTASSTDALANGTAESTNSLSCVVRPEQTEGPFFVDTLLDRADLRLDSATGNLAAGVPLTLTVGVSRVDNAACTPMEGAIVDLWHCDAQGVYSGVQEMGTQSQTFLRGYQQTDASGDARFTTIYPSWYPGRTVHIHIKIRTSMDDDAYEFTSQLYFDEDLTAQVLTHDAYARDNAKTTSNADDGIFRNDSGDQLLLSLTEDGDGYAGRIDLGLELSDGAVGASDAWRNRRRRG